MKKYLVLLFIIITYNLNAQNIDVCNCGHSDDPIMEAGALSEVFYLHDKDFNTTRYQWIALYTFPEALCIPNDHDELVWPLMKQAILEAMHNDKTYKQLLVSIDDEQKQILKNLPLGTTGGIGPKNSFINTRSDRRTIYLKVNLEKFVTNYKKCNSTIEKNTSKQNNTSDSVNMSKDLGAMKIDKDINVFNNTVMTSLSELNKSLPEGAIKNIITQMEATHQEAQLIKGLISNMSDEGAKQFNESMDIIQFGNILFTNLNKKIAEEERLEREEKIKSIAYSQDIKQRKRNFESQVFDNVIIIKNKMLTAYYKDDLDAYQQFNLLYDSYLNSSISAVLSKELYIAFNADKDLSSKELNSVLNKVVSDENRFKNYYFNTTVSNIYYGKNEMTSKKMLDQLQFVFSNDNNRAENVMAALQEFKLFMDTSLDYQPLMFALNRAASLKNTSLLNSIWLYIENEYKNNHIATYKEIHQTYLKSNNIEPKKINKALVSLGIKNKSTDKTLTSNGFNFWRNELSYLILKNQFQSLSKIKIEPTKELFQLIQLYINPKLDSHTFENSFENHFMFSDQRLLALTYQYFIELYFLQIDTDISKGDISMGKKNLKTCQRYFDLYRKWTTSEFDVVDSNLKTSYYKEKVNYISWAQYLNSTNKATSQKEAIQLQIGKVQPYQNKVAIQDFELINNRISIYNTIFQGTDSGLSVEQSKEKVLNFLFKKDYEYGITLFHYEWYLSHPN